MISFPTLRDSLPWRDNREEQEAPSAPYSYYFNSSVCGTMAPRKKENDSKPEET